MARSAPYLSISHVAAALLFAALAQGCAEPAGASLDVAISASDAAASDSTGTAAKPPDATPPGPEQCHWDCMGLPQCMGGKVHKTMIGPIACSKWQGSCPLVATYTCKAGCREVPPKADGTTALVAWCNEYPKVPGDPCKTDADCLPPANLPGTSTPAALTCIAAEHSCGLADAPTVVDYLAPCGLGLAALAKSGHTMGFVETPGCSGGVCLVISLDKPLGSFAACLSQRCTVACESVYDCPAGSECLGAKLYLAANGEATSQWAKHCVPSSLLKRTPTSGPCDIWW